MPRPKTNVKEIEDCTRFGVVPSSSQEQDMNENWEGDASVVVEYEEEVEGGRVKGKAREANLSAACLVCGGAAAAHQHYGAVCCYSCRAFFRRGIMRNYSCVRADNSCQVNSITRTNCKKCRFERCLEVGMRPELVDASLRRKQEEKRRQEILDIQQEMGIQTVAELESESQAVTGMMQLHHGVVHTDPGQQAVILQHQANHNVIQAVQGLQEPLPRHLLSQQVSQLSPGSVGRKKVLLELRHNEAQKKAERSPPVLVTEPQPPSQPLRQQTYYIFHPVTQTFEPITIAEFEENAVVEEVVVGDGPLDLEKTEDEDIAAVNEHDYLELSEEKNFVSQMENSRKRKKSSSPQREDPGRKPVISPVVREITSRSILCEPRQEIKISRKETKHFKQTSVIKKLSDKLIEDTVTVGKSNGTKPSSDLSRVIEQTIGEKSSIGAILIKEEITPNHERGVNIEALVDVCFEEELCKNTSEENSNEVNEGAPKRKSAPQVAALPLKKRRANNNDSFALNTDVEIFSHKTIQFNFTTEENIRLKKLREVLEILKSSDAGNIKVVSVSVERLLQQVQDLRQPLSFNSSLNSIVKCSTSKYLQVLGDSVKTTGVLTIFSRDDGARAIILLLKVLDLSPFLSAICRNLHLLLYRYLASLHSPSEAATFLREVQMIISR